MDQLHYAIDEVINLSSALLNASIRVKDLIIELKPNSWHYIQPSLQELYEQRQASLERYRQQYQLENGDEVASQSGEDEIDSKSEQKKQIPIESYYTANYRRFSCCSDES